MQDTIVVNVLFIKKDNFILTFSAIFLYHIKKENALNMEKRGTFQVVKIITFSLAWINVTISSFWNNICPTLQL